jgi:hypothetical protein
MIELDSPPPGARIASLDARSFLWSQDYTNSTGFSLRGFVLAKTRLHTLKITIPTAKAEDTIK